MLKRRIAALLWSGCLIFGLAACGGNSSGGLQPQQTGTVTVSGASN